jgi:hypothetical protein
VQYWPIDPTIGTLCITGKYELLVGYILLKGSFVALVIGVTITI